MYDENELFEIYRVKVCPSCIKVKVCDQAQVKVLSKSLQLSVPSKSFFDNKFQVKVYEEKGSEPSYIEYKCLDFE